MKRNESTEALLERWYAGTATEAEEQQLSRRMQASATDEAEPAIETLLFAGWQAMAAERMPGTLPAASPSPARRFRLRRLWLATAAAALLLGSVLAGHLFRRPYCYLDGVAVYDKEQALAATDCLQSLDALDRAGQLLEQLFIESPNPLNP